MSTKRLLKRSLDILEQCKDYLKEKACKAGATLGDVKRIPFNDLPKYVNDENELKKDIVLARLRKEKIFDNPEFILKSLYNIAFDVETYKSIGMNDGTLMTLKIIFEELGDKVHAKECYDWLYSE